MDEFISTLKKDDSVDFPVKIIDGFKIEIDSAATGSDDSECSRPLGCYDKICRSFNPSFTTSYLRQLRVTRETAGLYSDDRLRAPRLFDCDDEVLNQSAPGAARGASRWTNNRHVREFHRAHLFNNSNLSKPSGEAHQDKCFTEDSCATTDNTVIILNMSQKSPCIQYRSGKIIKSGSYKPQSLTDPKTGTVSTTRDELDKDRLSSMSIINTPYNSITACTGTALDFNRDENLILKQIKSNVHSRENFICDSYQTEPLDLSLPKNKSASCKNSRRLSRSGSHHKNLKLESSHVTPTEESALDLRFKTPTSVSKEEKCGDVTQLPPFVALTDTCSTPRYSQLLEQEFVVMRPGEQSSWRNVIYKPIPRYPEIHTGYASRHLHPFQAGSMMSDNSGVLNNEHMFSNGKYIHGTNRRNEMPWLCHNDYNMVWNYSTTVTPGLMQHARQTTYLPSQMSHSTGSIPVVPNLCSEKPLWCGHYDYLTPPNQRTSAFFTSYISPQTHSSMKLINSCNKERADKQYIPNSSNLWHYNYPIHTTTEPMGGPYTTTEPTGVPNTTAGYGSCSYLCPGEPTTRSHDDVNSSTILSQGGVFTPVSVTFCQTEPTQTMAPGGLFQRMSGLFHGATSRTNLGFPHGAISGPSLGLPCTTSSGSNLGLPHVAAAYGSSNELDAQFKENTNNPDLLVGRTCKERSLRTSSFGNPMMQQTISLRDRNVSNFNERPAAIEKSRTDYLHPNSCYIADRVKERGEVISDKKCSNETSSKSSTKSVKPRRQNKAKTPSKKCLYSDGDGDNSVDKKDGSQPGDNVTVPARKRCTTRRSKVNHDVGGRDTDAALNETLKSYRHSMVSSMLATSTDPGTEKKESSCLLANMLTNVKNPQHILQTDQSSSKRFKSAVDRKDELSQSKSCTHEKPEKIPTTTCSSAIKMELSEIPEDTHCGWGRSPTELLEDCIIKKLTEVINKSATPDLKVEHNMDGSTTKCLAETGTDETDNTGHHGTKVEPNDETITEGQNYDCNDNKKDMLVPDNTSHAAICDGEDCTDLKNSHHSERIDESKESNREGSSFVIDINFKGGEITSSVREIIAGSNKYVTPSGEQNISPVTKSSCRDERQYKCPDCNYRFSTLPAFQQHQSKDCYAVTKQDVSMHATDCMGKSGKFSVCQCTPCSLCKGIFSSKFRVFSHFKRGCFTKSRYCVEYKDTNSDSQQDREFVTSVRKVESIDYRLKFLSDANLNSSRVSEEMQSVWNQCTQKSANEDRCAQTDGERNSKAKNPIMKARQALNHGPNSKKGKQSISVLSNKKKIASRDSDDVASEAELNDSTFEENPSLDAAVNYSIKTEPLSPVAHYETSSMSNTGETKTPPRSVSSQEIMANSSTNQAKVVGEKASLPNKQDISNEHTISTVTAVSTMPDVDVKREIVDNDGECVVGGKVKAHTRDASCGLVTSEMATASKPWQEIESNPNSPPPRTCVLSEDKSITSSPALTSVDSIKMRCLNQRYSFWTSENQEFPALWSPSNSARDVPPNFPKIYIVDKKGSRKVLADFGNPPEGLEKKTTDLHTSVVNKRRCKRKRCQTKDELTDLTFSAATSAASQKSSTRGNGVESPPATLRVNTGNMAQNLPLKTAIAFGESQRVNKHGEKERIMYLLDANNKPIMLVEKIGKNNSKVHLPNTENM